MHKEKTVAEISSRGEAKVLDEQFMPYDLYLEREENGLDIDIRLNNLDNFIIGALRAFVFGQKICESNIKQYRSRTSCD